MAYSLEKAKARVAIVARLRRALKALGARGGCGLAVIAAQASQLLQELSAADIAALQLDPEAELEQLNPERLAMICRGLVGCLVAPPEARADEEESVAAQNRAAHALRNRVKNAYLTLKRSSLQEEVVAAAAAVSLRTL